MRSPAISSPAFFLIVFCNFSTCPGLDDGVRLGRWAHYCTQVAPFQFSGSTKPSRLCHVFSEVCHSAGRKIVEHGIEHQGAGAVCFMFCLSSRDFNHTAVNVLVHRGHRTQGQGVGGGGCRKYLLCFFTINHDSMRQSYNLACAIKPGRDFQFNKIQSPLFTSIF